MTAGRLVQYSQPITLSASSVADLDMNQRHPSAGAFRRPDMLRFELSMGVTAGCDDALPARERRLEPYVQHHRQQGDHDFSTPVGLSSIQDDARRGTRGRDQCGDDDRRGKLSSSCASSLTARGHVGHLENVLSHRAASLLGGADWAS